jgi:hypothetical protein
MTFGIGGGWGGFSSKKIKKQDWKREGSPKYFLKKVKNPKYPPHPPPIFKMDRASPRKKKRVKAYSTPLS